MFNGIFFATTVVTRLACSCNTWTTIATHHPCNVALEGAKTSTITQNTHVLDHLA